MQILLIIFESFIEKQMGIGKIPNSSWKVKWITLSTSNYCPTQQLHHHPSPPPPSLSPSLPPPPPPLPKKKVWNKDTPKAFVYKNKYFVVWNVWICYRILKTFRVLCKTQNIYIDKVTIWFFRTYISGHVPILLMDDFICRSKLISSSYRNEI